MEAINTSKMSGSSICAAIMNISLKKTAIFNVLKTLGLNGQTVSERTVNCRFKAAPY